MREEDWIWHTVESGPEIRAKVLLQLVQFSLCVRHSYVNRTREIIISHEDVCHTNPENDRQDPSSYEAFHGLLWGELDQLSFTKSNTADVCEDIIADDQGSWKEEPDHALEDIVHDEMSLNDNQI